jgi:hypothetical protein
MGVRRVPFKRVPFFLYCTYSFCLHAAALSFLVALPVFGSGKALPLGYVVTLAGPERPHHSAPGKTIRHDDNARVDKTPVRRRGEKGTGTAKAYDVRGIEGRDTARRKKDTRCESRSGSVRRGADVSLRSSQTGQAGMTPFNYLIAGLIDGILHPVQVSPQVIDRTGGLSKNVAGRGEKVDTGSLPSMPQISEEADSKKIGRYPVAAKQAAGNPEARENVHRDSIESIMTGLTFAKGVSLRGRGASEAAKRDMVPEGSATDPDAGDVPEASESGRGDDFSIQSSLDDIDLPGSMGDSDGDKSDTGGEGASMKEMSPGRESKEMQKTPAVSIHVPDALLVKDIEIEVVAEKRALSDISLELAARTHPGNRMRRREDAAMKIDGMQVRTAGGNTGTTAKKTLILRRAAKGVYLFSLKNNGKASSVDAVFHLHAGSEQESTKEYKSVSLKPAGIKQFKFLMPEAIFWDDDDRFSGTVEDGNSVTKFIYDTGLIWKEEK